QPIEIFPNPCHLLLNIKTKYDMQFPYCVCIRDLEGKIVYFNSQNVSQISLRDLKKGVYVLELYNTEHHYKKTFIKEY
ncbi:MAG: T9SS type A sorting domain-containing protein, partial [Bacteroidia bacterium]